MDNSVEKVTVKAVTSDIEKVKVLKHFGLTVYRDGNDYIADGQFNSIKEAKSHLCNIARDYYNSTIYSDALAQELDRIKFFNSLVIDDVEAKILQHPTI